MAYDFSIVKNFYQSIENRVEKARIEAGRPLTLTEKIFATHAKSFFPFERAMRGKAYVSFSPDRVCMQDATAQMALLQFMNAGKRKPSVPVTIHCDHLIQAYKGAGEDLKHACDVNKEVYDFLESAARRYGMGFWKPGAGIIHQTVLENYAFPGGLMVGTDSHTPNAGGLSMAAVGVGGADAVDVMTGTPWELRLPRIIGVRLVGKMSGWTSAKDIILCLAGKLTTKGGTNCVIEYFGDGVRNIPVTGRATICNMGAEVGATFSIFPYDERTDEYLKATNREDIAALASGVSASLRADESVTDWPEKFFDEIITVDLDNLCPMLNGPFTPDAATSVAYMPEKARKEGFPEKVEVCLIGSCTNSSYGDLARAASVVRAMRTAGHELRSCLVVCPGSELVRSTAERDGLLDIFTDAGANIMTNACGPCIGQWRRTESPSDRPNTIVTTFNRNFAKRADGNPNTFAFIASPEVAAGYAFTGTLYEHPSFSPNWATPSPEGKTFPEKGFCETNAEFRPACCIQPDSSAVIHVNPDSERLQLLTPFPAWDGEDFMGLPLLIKIRGKCTTDHISMAGKWLRYRGHLQNISKNFLLGAANAFTGEAGIVACSLTNEKTEVWKAAALYQSKCGGSVIVAEDNYGEGSSREHAAMEPRYLGVRAVLAKSFARIHETNLKKQGLLALTFAHSADYSKVLEGDRITVHCKGISSGSPVRVDLIHADGTIERIFVNHTYNAHQIEWFRAGSALNFLQKK